jgi:predicted AAA+ superfamily ATPase
MYKMIYRELEKTLEENFESFPSITLIGPRQSGKTTLVKKLFPDFAYFNLENPDERMIAVEDPRSLFAKNQNLIIDEAQRVPDLFSYIQTYLDGGKNKVIITGSNQHDLNAKISQSLAGRTAIFKLLPLSLAELNKAGVNHYTDQQIYKGFYPAIYDRGQNATITYRSYFETYLQKDVRQILNIGDLALFEKFVRLCAGRVGSLLNFSSLSNDVGVSVNTLQSWFSVLEASFICFRLQPFHANINKRLVKSSKLYFYDVGLAAYLLGIEEVSQIGRDPLKGVLFENMIVAEFLKKRYNAGLDHNGYFFRDNNGLEVDYLAVNRDQINAFEIKSAATYQPGFKKSIEQISKIEGLNITSKNILYDGKTMTGPNGFEILNWQEYFVEN